MSAKKDPEPDDLRQLVDALARASAADRGLLGDDARRHVDDLKSRVETVMVKTHLREQGDAQKQQVAAAIDELIDSVARVQNATGAAIAKQSPELKRAFRGVDLGKMADALRLLSDWLRDPTPEKQAAVEELVDGIRAVTGASAGFDPEREERERKEQIQKDVRASLDEIFQPPKKPF